MAKSGNIKQFAGQRLKELFPRATGWQEQSDYAVGSQTVDLMVRFKMGTAEPTLIVESSSVGQPRQIRETITRLADVRRELPAAYPIVVADYVSPQSAALLKRSGLGYLDLSGNCYLSFDHVLIEKDGKPNLRPSTRPLRSLFAPRATRVTRVLLVDPQHAWRLEELAKSADVSLGHAHNVVKRLEDLSWVERDEHQRFRLSRPVPGPVPIHIAALRPANTPAQLQAATLGNPSALKIGDDAIVVGNPFSLTRSLSTGVISGLDRSVQAPNQGRTLTGLIQFDAAVNPGSSGGPLVNRDGEVVGIVTGLVNPTGQPAFSGVGFAVTIDTAASALGVPPD